MASSRLTRVHFWREFVTRESMRESRVWDPPSWVAMAVRAARR